MVYWWAHIGRWVPCSCHRETHSCWWAVWRLPLFFQRGGGGGGGRGGGKEFKFTPYTLLCSWLSPSMWGGGVCWRGRASNHESLEHCHSHTFQHTHTHSNNMLILFNLWNVTHLLQETKVISSNCLTNSPKPPKYLIYNDIKRGKKTTYSVSIWVLKLHFLKKKFQSSKLTIKWVVKYLYQYIWKVLLQEMCKNPLH